MDNKSLRAVLSARNKQETLHLYTADLIYLDAKSRYTKFEGQMPSELAKKLRERQGAEMDGKKIKDNLVKKLKRRRRKRNESI